MLKKCQRKVFLGSAIRTFKGPLVQEGYGIGSMFKKFFKWITPVLKKHAVPLLEDGVNAVGKELANNVSNVSKDIFEGKNVKESIKNNARKSLGILKQKTSEKKQNMLPKLKKGATFAGEEISQGISNFTNDIFAGKNIKKALDKNVAGTVNRLKVQAEDTPAGEQHLDNRQIDSKHHLEQETLKGSGIKRKSKSKNMIILKKSKKNHNNIRDIFD